MNDGERTPPDLVALGTFIRARRQDLGLTQADLAARIGWTQERVSTLENARYGLPSLPQLAKLAEVCGTTIADVLRVLGYDPDPALAEVDTDLGPATAAVLLYTCEQVMALPTSPLLETLTTASTIIGDVTRADKVDVFLADEAAGELVAAGTSRTAMGAREKELGLDRYSLAAGGNTARSYLERCTVSIENAADDPNELPRLVHELGVRSMVLVPIYVDGTCRGVLSATSRTPAQFTSDDCVFLQVVARWMGLLIRRDTSP
jgi:transcriptional regulator with XRE-family HTH domain